MANDDAMTRHFIAALQAQRAAALDNCAQLVAQLAIKDAQLAARAADVQEAKFMVERVQSENSALLERVLIAEGKS